MLRVPLVASFHTNVPNYLPKLGLQWLVRAGGLPACRSPHIANLNQ